MLVNGVSLLRWSCSLLLGPVALAATACESTSEESTGDWVVSEDTELVSSDPDDADDDLLAPGRVQPLAGQSTLAFTSPRGLIASTGNLYWTSTSVDEFGPDSSVVWRASKGNVPGSEFPLYGESGDDRWFGAIVYANPGAFFGYFVANYIGPTGVTSQIKRVPLTGGPAVVIANSPAPIANRDLVTDGTRLFWVDAAGIRSVALAGGPITTLRSSTVITRLRVDSSFIYYGEEFLIFRMPKAGGFGQVVVSTNGRVSALHVDGGIGWLFWGEIGGGVRASPSSQSGGGAQITYQASIAGRDVSSVGWDGSRPLWTDCAQPGNTSCRVMKRQGGINQTLSSGGVGVGFLQWDPASLYWGDAGALRKYVH